MTFTMILIKAIADAVSLTMSLMMMTTGLQRILIRLSISLLQIVRILPLQLSPAKTLKIVEDSS